MRNLVSCFLSVVLSTSTLSAQEMRGPNLAVASNFGQGFLFDLMQQALAAGVDDFRDALYWDRVEQADGVFAFTTPQTRYPDFLADGGGRMSLTVNNGHPAYDDGHTPLSDAAVAGFGRHAAETVLRFPAIDAVEVGNEFNSQNFVDGPIRDKGIEARAEAYTALLKSVATQTRAVRPDVRIIGGGVHSIPTGYLQMLVDRGAAEHMDTLALHPYSTPVEHYAKQIAVMRRIPELATIPVEITEFGTQDAALAPGKLIRSHCQYGLAGASRLAWYALNVRGDDYAPLITRDGTTTPVMDAYLFAQEQLAGQPMADVSPDPFTYACLYDGRILVLWGMPRAVQVASGVAVHDATSDLQDGQAFTLSETEPLVIVGDGPIALGRDVILGQQRVVADSYHGFTYPAGADAQTEGGLLRETLSQSGATAFQTMPGQARAGRPWTPWLGIEGNGDVRLLPRTLLPGVGAEVVQSYTAPDAIHLDITARFAPAARSTDGVAVKVTLGDQTLWSGSGKGPHDIDLDDVAMGAGETLRFTVGTGDTRSGDVTDYRITLRQAE